MKRYFTRGRWALFAVAAAGILMLAAPVHANKATERSKQKQAAESERAELRRRLADLKREIGKTESARSHAADALADSEAAISQANRALRELARERHEVEARLTALDKEQARLDAAANEQRARLATVLREQHIGGGENRIKLLLSGDNPNRIGRDLQYMGYVSQAQARLIAALQEDLRAIEENRAQAQNARAELEEIASEQEASKDRLEREKARRADLLAELSDKLAAQRKEAGSIERDQQRLTTLVNRLTRLIEEQRKAEAAGREKRRQEQMARAAREASSSARKTPSRDSGSIDNDREKVVGRNELTPDPAIQDAVSGRAFSSLRGQLRLPVRGDLIARFGTTRTDGPSWKGLFIRTAEGEDVKAVAGGQVVFADWLRGFGNLIIIDHGGEYMTIYGNNQAVLKQAGDTVKIGDVIATTGSSGGSEHSGLYFEMRHQGRAFDPMRWIAADSIKK